MVDGVVGDQTWASLRGEEPAAVGTDGNLHQQTDHGLHAVWFEDQNAHGRTGEYRESEDAVWFFLECVGDSEIPATKLESIKVGTGSGDNGYSAALPDGLRGGVHEGTFTVPE